MSRYEDNEHELGENVTTPANLVDQKGAQAAWENMPQSQHSLVSATHKFVCTDVQDLGEEDEELEGWAIDVLDLNTDHDGEDAPVLGSFTLLRNGHNFEVNQGVFNNTRLLTPEAVNAFLAVMAASKPEPKKALSPAMMAIADQITGTLDK